MNSFRTLCAITLLALAVRAITFSNFTSLHERFRQPDSLDYHYAALYIKHGYGMTEPGKNRPLFWRTPGYPAYLATFYQAFNAPAAAKLSYARHALNYALWTQIIICSLLPILVYLLAYSMFANTTISLISAFLVAISPGFVLTSGYLLTDGLGSLLFILFLLFFWRAFFQHKKRSLFFACAAALALGVYTWFRPMGQFIGIAATAFALFSPLPWRKKTVHAALFLAVFLMSLAPWAIRNYRLTGDYFFCPLGGLYLNVFCAPKIMARVKNIPLETAHKNLTHAAAQELHYEIERRTAVGDSRIVCGENWCMKTAWPIISSHPLYFLWDWLIQVLKTTFDLHSSQFVYFARNTFWYDPLIEYLGEKTSDVLWKEKISFTMRIIAWLELILSLFVWSGLLGGTWFFLIKNKNSLRSAWLMITFFSIITVCQSGGYGYARLRLPIEPLMMIGAAAFWWWYLKGTRARSVNNQRL